MHDGGMGAAVLGHASQGGDSVAHPVRGRCGRCNGPAAEGADECAACADRMRIGEAFEELCRPMQAALSREVGRALAEEMVQEVFLRAIARSGAGGIRSLDMGYMLKCASRLARRARRGEVHRQRREEESGRRRLCSAFGRHEVEPARSLMQQEELLNVGDALESLPEQRRVALRMLLADRRSHREVSRATGVAETTLVNWRHRFVCAMRREHECRD